LSLSIIPPWRIPERYGERGKALRSVETGLLMNAPLTICLLGPFAVQIDGSPLPPLRSRKGQWLLALLALRADRDVPRDWLAGLLWPESEQADALRSLRQSLNDLRRAFGTHAYRLHSPDTRTLRLLLDDAFVDVGEFDAAIAQDDIPALQEAVTLYRGTLLEGCTEPWVVAEREQREQAYLRALATLAAHATQRGDHAAAVRTLRLVVSADPLDEVSQRALMQALAAEGDYAAAVLVYRELRLQLRRELNIDPDPQTTALFDTLRDQARQAAEKSRVSGVGCRVSEKDGERQEATGESGEATSDTRHPTPDTLPAPSTSFVGRETALREIGRSLRNARLVTLVGVGGIGKTRLAIEAAREQQEDYPDGIWFAEVTSLTEAVQIPVALANVLQVQETPGRTLLENVLAFLSDRSLLLVLDNCEHLLTGCAEVALTLLQACPRLSLLVTSRHPLGVAGEAICRVSPLELPESAETGAREKEESSAPAELLQYAGIRLFVERAQAVQPRFAITEQNATAVADLCRHLDGLPLALELAAALVNALSVEDLVVRLANPLRLRSREDAERPERQRSLQATLDLSYALLSDTERALLRRIAVFTGGCTLEAVERVCADEDLSEEDIWIALAQLTDKTLIRAEEDGRGRSRYRLLETIREYGRKQLREQREEENLRLRHRYYFLAFAEEAAPHVVSSDQAEWLERLAAEHSNLRAALQWSVEGTMRVRLAAALWRYWDIRGHWQEGRGWLEKALSQMTPPTRERALASQGAGALAWRQGDYDAAQQHYEASLETARAINDPQRIAAALHSLGILSMTQDKNAAARAFFEECLAIFRGLEDRRGIASTLANLGLVTTYEKDFPAARAFMEESLTLHRERGDPHGVATGLGCLGYLTLQQEDYAAARTYLEEALTIQRELGDRREISFLLSNLGQVYGAAGDHATALAVSEESLTIVREMGDPMGEAGARINLAHLARKRGDVAEARRLYQETLALARELDAQDLVAECSQWLRALEKKEGKGRL
jgi:predicted ATPase/DNA-binding SARP family transcriptional activator